MSATKSPAAPAAQPEAIRAFYNQFSSEHSRNYIKKGNLRIDKAIARILPLVREDSQVLEIGCGAGIIAEQIARVAVRGFVSACDISDSAIALARERLHAANVQFRALDVGARFEELKSWLPAPIDLLVMVDVLEHLPLERHENFFQNLTSVVRPESTMALTFPSPQYQRYLRQHLPDELQIIDEVVELPHLYEVATKAGWSIQHFSLESVWFPNQYVHCILTLGSVNYSATDKNSAALEKIANLIQPGEKFILVDQDEWQQKAPPERHAFPFLEKDGVYWGPPADDETALREVKRLQSAGAACIVFASSAFWWLEHYQQFHRHLSQFQCICRNDNLIVFDLRKTALSKSN